MKVDVTKAGLRWETDVQVRRDAAGKLFLALKVAVTNTSNRAVRAAPGRLGLQWSGARIGDADPKPEVNPDGSYSLGGLGVRYEGLGPVCNIGHGVMPKLRPGKRDVGLEQIDEIDPLPWAKGWAQHFEGTTRVCDGSPGDITIVDILVVPPDRPGDLPTLRLTPDELKHESAEPAAN